MNFISCDGCGVVLDSDAPMLFTQTKTEQSKNFDGHTVIDYVECPVCKGDVAVTEEEVEFNEEGEQV